jgi:hypothetical protein
VAAAILVSDRSAPVLCGLEPRVFRALVAKLGIPCMRVGKRLLCRATDLADAIGRASEEPGHITDASAEEAREPSRSEILARIAGGHRR